MPNFRQNGELKQRPTTNSLLRKQNINHKLNCKVKHLPGADGLNDDSQLLSEFGNLWTEVDAVWDRHQDSPPFEGYVSADYLSVFQALTQLRGKVKTVMEWGSGLGVVTIMASRMGFEAYGIEAESKLVDYAESFAKKYAPKSRFAVGSFIPDQYSWNPAAGEEVNQTVINLPAAYDQFDIELRDVDLVYAYPWPEEHHLYHSILSEFGRQDMMLLTYDGREGIELHQFH